MSAQTAEQVQAKSPLKEITQPFIDLIHAPRVLWGINAAYLIEGFCYFGILQYLAMYFVQYAGLDDIWSQRSKMVLTAGITIAMFFFGGRADKWGVRFALLGAFVLMIIGRAVLAFAPQLGGTGMASPMYIAALAGLLLVVLGYGMYQPAAYAGVRQFTTPATAGMGYAMLYALMNLGGWLPTFMAPVRNQYGISSAYWIYVVLTVVSLVVTWALLTRRTVADAMEKAKADAKSESPDKTGPATEAQAAPEAAAPALNIPPHLWGTLAVVWGLAGFELVREALHFRQTGEAPLSWFSLIPALIVVALTAAVAVLPGAKRRALRGWLAVHPLANAKFFFFIFSLIPVQTLFAYNFGTIQAYVDRAYRGTWIGTNFEAATNLNSLLIFVLVPMVTAMTQKRKVYNMMILGTLVMSAPAFFLALGTNLVTLAGYIVVMTVGEAMWQPRFLQYAAQIAPEGRTGAYMGVAQFPWFLTKIIVPLYEGWFLQRYCPQTGAIQSQTMWLIFGCIAVISPILLVLAKGWAGKDMKTTSA
jgi:MFS family permease